MLPSDAVFYNTCVGNCHNSFHEKKIIIIEGCLHPKFNTPQISENYWRIQNLNSIIDKNIAVSFQYTSLMGQKEFA